MRKRRGNTRYFSIFTAVIAGSYFIYWLSSLLFTNLDIFIVREINFTGNQAIYNDDLQNACNSLIGTNLFSISESETKNLFSGFSRIKDLSLSRKIPDKLEITIVERVPIFKIKTSDGIIYPVDAESFLLSGSESYLPENLPIISIVSKSDSLLFGCPIKDDFLADMLNAYPKIKSLEPDFFNHISEIYKNQDGLFLVEYEHGYKISLDENNFIENIIDYMEIRNTCSYDRDTIIDMTLANTYRVQKRED
jgi:hypothetical protein